MPQFSSGIVAFLPLGNLDKCTTRSDWDFTDWQRTTVEAWPLSAAADRHLGAQRDRAPVDFHAGSENPRTTSRSTVVTMVQVAKEQLEAGLRRKMRGSRAISVGDAYHSSFCMQGAGVVNLRTLFDDCHYKDSAGEINNDFWPPATK